MSKTVNNLGSKRGVSKANGTKNKNNNKEIIIDFPMEIYDFIQKIGSDLSNELDGKLKLLHDFVVKFSENNSTDFLNIDENDFMSDDTEPTEEITKAHEILKNQRNKVQNLTDSAALQILSENLKRSSNAVKKDLDDHRDKLLKILDEKLKLEMAISGLKLKYTILDGLIEVLE